MSELSNEVKRVHENTDFKVEFVGVTKPNEFQYTHGGRVTAGLEYHIHYTNDKKEVYMIGGAHTSNSKIIEKVSGEQSTFSQYSSLGTSDREDYPQKVLVNPTESDYTTGSITRYFTQRDNNLNGELFEISEKDFENKNSLFRYISIQWRISGNKDEVVRDNLRTINTTAKTKGNETLRTQLYPLQLWRPVLNTKEDITRKLGRLKVFIEEVVPQWGEPDWVNPNDFIHRDELDDDFVRPDPYTDQMPPWDKYPDGP
tara:strand:+ start:176 stop:946 length:771 start_codon:yes stop_codon:yes gene_type:complete